MKANLAERILPQSHLINLLVQTREHQPSFTLFLGAGASIRSGVRSAASLVKEWRQQYAAIHGGGQDVEEILREQKNEYSFLFQALFDHPSQRRNFIESCIKDASPSWGYIYLVNLIHSKIFNTVFTTNFDDLLNEACFAYSSQVRPVVCAHDSSISNVRIFSSRPKIIKLHGDFLFDSIKNTEMETKSLEKNMKDKFDQYAAEFGVIVLGYSGNDRSVMDPIETLLERDAFPNGVYWCVRKEGPVSSYVSRLQRFSKFKMVQIEGFDEFSADLHSALGLSLQPELKDPYGSLTRKLDGLMRKMSLPINGETHPVIERDVAQLAEQLIGMAVAGELRSETFPITSAQNAAIAAANYKIPVPFVFLANFSLRRGEFDRAHLCVAAALRQEPSRNAFEAAFRSLRLSWDDKLADFVVNEAEKSIGIFDDPGNDFTDFALEMMHAGQYAFAQRLLTISDRSHKNKDRLSIATFDLNVAQLHLHKGEEIPSLLVQRVVEILNDSDMPPVFRMGAAVVLNKWDIAEGYLKEIVKASPRSAAAVATWPIYTLLSTKLEDKALETAMDEIRDGFLAGRVISLAHSGVAKLLELSN